MSLIDFARTELAEAARRGVRQCVVIGSEWARLPQADADRLLADATMQVFAVGQEPVHSTRVAVETLAAALAKAGFDKMRAGLFIWLGGTGYRTVDSVINNLAFIASLPSGSSVVLDYAVDSIKRPQSALHALASHVLTASGTVMEMIQPQAVSAMLRGVGFHNVVDLAQPGETEHLVSAMV